MDFLLYNLNLYFFPITYFLINIFSFLLFFIDKQLAIKKKKRISENTLLISCSLFGALGAIIAMHLFKHKTKKLFFRIYVPLILITQFLIFILMIKK